VLIKLITVVCTVSYNDGQTYCAALFGTGGLSTNILHCNEWFAAFCSPVTNVSQSYVLMYFCTAQSSMYSAGY